MNADDISDRPRMVRVMLTCEIGAVMDTLIAIERSRAHGVYDDDQIRRLTPVVFGLRHSVEDVGDD